MKVKQITIAIVTDEPAKHVKAILHDVDEISDEIKIQAADDSLAAAVASVIDFAKSAAAVYDDAHALVIDKDNVEHLSAHPKAKAKAAAKSAPKKKAKAKRNNKSAAD